MRKKASPLSRRDFLKALSALGLLVGVESCTQPPKTTVTSTVSGPTKTVTATVGGGTAPTVTITKQAEVITTTATKTVTATTSMTVPVTTLATTTQPPPMTYEPISWIDVKEYTGIPSPDCKPPVTELTGLPPASFQLTVDVTNQVGNIDPHLWANSAGNGRSVLVSNRSMPFWELNRQTQAVRCVRIWETFSSGLGKWAAVPISNLLQKGEMPLPADPIGSQDPLGHYSTFCFALRVYDEDDKGNPIYTFWYLDSVLDISLSAGLKPVVILGYMPDAIAEGEKIREYVGGLTNVPRDYAIWRDLVYHTVKHCIERYGAEEVRTWYWECWNEPDNEPYFVDAKSNNPQRYLKIYDFAAAGAKAADSEVKVGGPAIAGRLNWLEEFLSHCASGRNDATGGIGATLDFISLHRYGNMDILRTGNEELLRVIRKYPAFKNIPTLEDEWGQEIFLYDATGKVIADIQNMDEEYTNHEAAFLIRYIDFVLADPENQPNRFFRAGNLTSVVNLRFYSISGARGTGKGLFIPMPVLNAYLLLAKLGKDRVELAGTSIRDPVHGFATRTSNGVQILLYNFNEADRKSEGKSVEVDLTVKGIPAAWSIMKRYLIDSQYSSAYLGYKPQVGIVSAEQWDQMEKNSKLKIVEASSKLETKDGKAVFRLKMSTNSVSLVVVGEEASPPKLTPSAHVARIMQEEAEYKAALDKLIKNDTVGAKAAFEQLVKDSFAAVTDKSNNNPYSLWSQKALFVLYNIESKQQNSAAADKIRVQLLNTTLGDIERYVLLNDRLRYLDTTGNKDEVEKVKGELEPVRSRLTYFANWSNWSLFIGVE